MISFAAVSKQYGRQVVFVDASFQLNPGERAGLVGPNGAGKTTLFRMIAGEESADDGSVNVPKKLSIGYFRQEVDEMRGRPVLDEAIAGSGRLGDLHHELLDLEQNLHDEAALARYGEVQEEYQHLGGYELEARAREVLHGLGFDDAQIDGDAVTYSGDYDFYVRERELRESNQEAAYARQQAKLAKEQRFIDRFTAHAAKAAQVQSRIKMLDKQERIEPPKKRRAMKFDFRRPPRSGDDVATLAGVKKAFGAKRVYDDFDFQVRRGERWCVMGKNGAGKSTLLKMVAGALPQDSGTVKLGASL